MVIFVVVALLMAAISGVVWKLQGERSIGVVSLMWASYAVYESLMAARLLCSGECNIRVDLLVIVPILLGVTAGAIAKVERKKRRRAGAGQK